MNNGADFLAIADHLLATASRVPQEAAFRSAYGRSYYGVLNVACSLLLDAGFSVERGPRKHEQVRSLLKMSKDAVVQSCGTRLGQMSRTRNNCDYEMGLAVSGGTAAQGVQWARDIVADLAKAKTLSDRLFIP